MRRKMWAGSKTFRLNCDPQIMTAEDSISDDVFEMDNDCSSVTNVLSGGLTPAAGERALNKTPSPTGYRDYKPPPEVLSNNYSTTFRTTRDFDNVRSTLKRDHEKEDNFTHKVSRAWILSRETRGASYFASRSASSTTDARVYEYETPSVALGEVPSSPASVRPVGIESTGIQGESTSASRRARVRRAADRV